MATPVALCTAQETPTMRWSEAVVVAIAGVTSVFNAVGVLFAVNRKPAIWVRSHIVLNIAASALGIFGVSALPAAAFAFSALGVQSVAAGCCTYALLWLVWPLAVPQSAFWLLRRIGWLRTVPGEFQAAACGYEFKSLPSVCPECGLEAPAQVSTDASKAAAALAPVMPPLPPQFRLLACIDGLCLGR